MQIRQISVLIISIYVAFKLIGCTTPSTSTGIIGSGRPNLPPGVPQRVAVIPFQGDFRINVQATDQFMVGLPNLGFITVERQQINAIIGEFNFQQTGYISAETRNRLKELLGVDGLFLGSITGESSRNWVDSHLNIRLIELETGKIVWAAEVHDPRSIGFNMDIRTSASYTVKNALKILKRDLEKQ